MIIMRKQIVAFVLVLFAIAAVFFGIKKYESRQTFADRDFKIVLDAGHDGLGECFKRGIKV